MKLIVHVGAHKTATTHLQRRLQSSSAALRQRGAAYYGPAALRGEVPLSSLLAWPGRWPEVEAGWRARLDADEAAGMERVVLSEENLLGSMTPGELFDPGGRLYPHAGPRLAALFALLGRRPVTVAMAVREPGSFVTSAFGMWLLGGGGALIEEFLRDADPAVFRWSELARRLLVEGGTPRLTVWRFEDYPHLRNRVLARLLSAERVAVVRTRRRALVGWSQAAYDAFVARVLEAGPDDSLAEMARTSREAHPRLEGMQPMRVLPEALLDRTAAAYPRDLDALRGMPRVRWIG